MTPIFMLLTEGIDGEIIIMNTGKGKPVTAREENKHLLITIGDTLLGDKLILGYQLIQIAGPAVR